MWKPNHISLSLFNIQNFKQKLSMSMYPGVNVCQLFLSID